MAIFMDRVNRDGWAHLVSDYAGERGKRELVEFGMLIGLERRLHRDSTYAEHYDIREEEANRAIRVGAQVVSRRELADILKWKKCWTLRSVQRIEQAVNRRNRNPFSS